VHGDAAVVPPDAPVCGIAVFNDRALVPIRSGVDADYFSNTFMLRVKTDGNVELSCAMTTPPLKKEDAIAALLAQAVPTPGSKECTDYLVALDPAWAHTQCE
jgi:hypothetical protein